MRKKILVLFLLFSIVVPGATLAVNQPSNSEAYLGGFDFRYGSWTSNYCTATQSHMNLNLSVSNGTARYEAQRRAPNGNWVSMLSSGQSYHGATSSSAKHNMNVIRGYDYRLVIRNGNSPLRTSGVVTCS